MSRIKRGVVTKQKHKKILKMSRGFWGQRGNIFLRAKETLLRAMAFSFVGRKQCKRNFRRLFISRINASLKRLNLRYGETMNKIKSSGIFLNRKILSNLSIFDPSAFSLIVSSAISISLNQKASSFEGAS
jgi:large subunit ribosomal protein L20